MPASDVAAASPATSSWANAVADAIQELEADLYPSVYGQLAIPWASLTGVPATFTPTVGTVTAQTGYGASSTSGAATSASRSDHTHGTPPVPNAQQVGAPYSYNTPNALYGGKKLYVGTATPSGAAEGDIWIKG